MFISELHIQGYKRLRDVKLPLGPLTVLIGPNASGKSSVVEVLDLLGRSAERQLVGFSRLLGGMDRCVSRGVHGEGFAASIASPGTTPDDGLLYELQVVPSRGGDYALREMLLPLQAEPGGLRDPVLEAGAAKCHYREGPSGMTEFAKPAPFETGLSQAPLPDGRTDAFRRRLQEVCAFGPLDVRYGSVIRRSQQVRPAKVPRPDGEEFLAALQTKESNDPNMFAFLQDALRSAYPGFDGIALQPVGSGQVELVWRERGEKYYGGELSDGALRFLWLATILSNSDPPPLIMIDEPEVSLHPALLVILRDLLEEGANGGQVLVATQSPELVSWLKPEQIVVLDLDEEGWATATPGTELDVARWLERYTLGELWTNGVLGGRP